MSFCKPDFGSLPLRKDGPPGNAWGLFGEHDELGMLNLLTPETTKAAAKEIVEGVRVSTDWPLASMAVPCFGRRAFEHTLVNKAPRPVNDDMVTFNTQSSSQWDGFRHFAYKHWPEKDVYTYHGGMTEAEALDTTNHKYGTQSGL